MKSASPSPASTNSPQPLAVRYVLAGLLVAVALALACRDSQVSPFAAADVLVVHLLAALPLAIAIVGTALGSWTVARCATLGALCLLASAAAFVACTWNPDVGRQWANVISGFALRIAIAVGLVTGGVLCGSQLLQQLLQLNPYWQVTGRSTVLLSAILLPVATFTYENARCQNDRIRLTDYLEQSRLRDSQTVALRLLLLQPQAELRGKPIAELAGNIRQAIGELEERIAQPLSPRATSPQKIARARDLAILGENASALDVLASMPDLTSSPAACNLLGTIGETEQTWAESAQWYRRAQENCLSHGKSNETSAELLRATKGLAYCQRKQGDFAAAEQTYLQLLSLAPTADIYFLLATFYEDTQQVTKAQSYARQAMALAPDRYQADGQRLIDKLITHHFGCLKAFTAEESPGATGPTASAYFGD